MILLEGLPDPVRIAKERREGRVLAARARHAGKVVRTMTPAEQGELLEALAQALGIADENGQVVG